MALVTSLEIRDLGSSPEEPGRKAVEVRLRLSLQDNDANGLLAVLDGTLDILIDLLGYPSPNSRG